jgi:hypothetical protein
MAQAKDVRNGQVWRAKVSGVEVDVEILSEVPGGTGRKRFVYKNLKTGRTGKGTAGRFHKLVRDASPHGDPAAVVPPPTSANVRVRGRPVELTYTRKNPSHYPSAAAEAACVALSRSNAQTPHEVMAVVDHAMRQLAGIGPQEYEEERRRAAFVHARQVNPHPAVVDHRQTVLRQVYSTQGEAMSAGRRWAAEHGGQAVGVARSGSGYAPVVSP